LFEIFYFFSYLSQTHTLALSFFILLLSSNDDKTVNTSFLSCCFCLSSSSRMSLNDEDSHEAPSGETETQGFQDYGFTSDSSLFTYQPRERAVKQIGQYVLGDLIGEGAYSRVREAICSITLRFFFSFFSSSSFFFLISRRSGI